MAIYNLSRDLDRERFKTRVNALYAQGKTVEMTERKGARTLPQNAYLHLLLQHFATQIGEGDVSHVKEQYYKRECNADIFLVDRHDALLGRTIQATRSVSTLSAEEMSLSIDRFKIWAAEKGFYLPDAARPDEIAQAQQEVDYNRPFMRDTNPNE